MDSFPNLKNIIDSICRVCLGQEDLTSMDQTLINGSSSSIKEMLEMVTSTKVNELLFLILVFKLDNDIIKTIIIKIYLQL